MNKTKIEIDKILFPKNCYKTSAVNMEKSPALVL